MYANIQNYVYKYLHMYIHKYYLKLEPTAKVTFAFDNVKQYS